MAEREMKNLWTVGDVHFARAHDNQIVCWSAGSVVRTETWAEAWDAAKALFDKHNPDPDRTVQFQHAGMFWDRELNPGAARRSWEYWRMPPLPGPHRGRGGDRTKKEQVTFEEYEEAKAEFLNAKREELRAKFLTPLEGIPRNAIKFIVYTQVPTGDTYTRWCWLVPV